MRFFVRPKNGIQKGLTLVEIVVVVGIIAILLAIVLPSFNEVRQNSRDKARIQALKQMQLALSTFYERTGQYPDGSLTGSNGKVSCSDDEDFLSVLVSTGLFGQIEKDPLNREPHLFGYVVSPDRDTYVLTAILENDDEAMQSDNGQCDRYYEVGPWKKDAPEGLVKQCSANPNCD